MTDLMEPVTGDRRAAAARRRRQRRQAYLSVLAFVVILAVGAWLRLWHLNISPAWQWDEAVYCRVSVNVQHGVLAEHHTVLRTRRGSRSCTSRRFTSCCFPGGSA